MIFYFSKKYEEKPFDVFMEDINPVNYYKCINCGFTCSRTHSELSDKRWKKLNYDFHHFLENPNFKEKKLINQPPYLQQALMIKVLSEKGIIDAGDMLDFAGGYGTLSNILYKYFCVRLPVYDPYIQKNERTVYISKRELKKYKVVINSALFEHLTQRSAFDEINNCVEDDGCMIIHTVVCENIPKDSSWFYFTPPVHCAFHTNRSMDILMKQWNYISSIYCPISKCWVLFKKEAKDLNYFVNEFNQELQNEYLFYKNGFVDFWK